MAKTLIGIATTDTNGVATITYEAIGAGNIAIAAKNSSLTSQAVTVEDCKFYDNATSNKSSNYVATLCEGGTYPSISYNNDYYSVTGGSKTTSFLLTDLGQFTNCEITFKCKPISNDFAGALGIAFGTGSGNVCGLIGYSNGQVRKVRYLNSYWQESFSTYYTGSVDADGYITMRITKYGSGISGNCGESNFTFTLPFSDCYIGVMLGATNVKYFKEIKIKPLETIITNGESPTPTPTITLEITGNSFNTYSTALFTYTDEVTIDWGDNTIETYAGGEINSQLCYN